MSRSTSARFCGSALGFDMRDFPDPRYDIYDHSISGIELRHFPYQIELTRLGNEIHGRFYVKHRDTGAEIEIAMFERLPFATTEQDAQIFLRDVLLRMIAHELDEALHFNGVRAFDPHRDGG